MQALPKRTCSGAPFAPSGLPLTLKVSTLFLERASWTMEYRPSTRTQTLQLLGLGSYLTRCESTIEI